MKDILDTKREEKLKTKEKQRRKRELGDLRKLLSMPEFRRVVWRVVGKSGFYTEPMTGNSQTFYNIGAQSVGRWILDEIFEADPNVFAKIQAEAISEAKSQKEEEDE